MTRREFADPFGSDDEEETVDNKAINNKVPEMNGDVNGLSHAEPKDEKEKAEDVFSDLPKPNPVSVVDCFIGSISMVVTIEIPRYSKILRVRK